MIINYINNLLTKLIWWYIKWRFGTRFLTIKNKTTLINSSVSLSDLFNHIMNVYHVEYSASGISGLYKLRKAILAQINSLSVSNVFHKDKDVDESELKDSLKQLYVFKDLLHNIKYTIELFTYVKVILSFISKAAFIPFLVLWLWVLVRGLLRFSTYGIAGFAAQNYLNTQTEYGSKLYAIIDWFRILSVRMHNAVFMDNLPIGPKSRIPSDPIPSNYIPVPIDSVVYP